MGGSGSPRRFWEVLGSFGRLSETLASPERPLGGPERLREAMIGSGRRWEALGMGGVWEALRGPGSGRSWDVWDPWGALGGPGRGWGRGGGALVRVGRSCRSLGGGDRLFGVPGFP